MRVVLGLTVATIAAVTTNAQSILRSTYAGAAGLNDAAKAVGKYMGTATDYLFDSSVAKDKYYMNELKNTKDWSMVTTGNMLKPAYTEPSRNTFSYAQGDQFMAFAKAAGLKVRCHTLAWHSQSPDWLTTNSFDKTTMLSALTNHITNLMTHYGDNCYAWDVVNEVVDDNGGYRNSFWYQKTGSSYIAHAFNIANQVKTKLGLKTKLYYNDYSIEWDGSAKTTFAQNMVKGLLAQGVKIDGVGFQSHFTVGGGTPSKASFMKVMKFYTDLGLDVAVTELDIRAPTPISTANQRQQKTDYTNVVSACANTARCVGVTVWDFPDTYSWIPSVFGGQGSALPFYQPYGKGTTVVRKIAYDGIIDGWKK